MKKVEIAGNIITIHIVLLNNCCARDTVFKDAAKHTPHMTDIEEFKEHKMRLLPSNKIVEVYVRPFKKTLDYLLTKTNLIVEENISLPDALNPYGFENYTQPH